MSKFIMVCCLTLVLSACGMIDDLTRHHAPVPSNPDVPKISHSNNYIANSWLGHYIDEFMKSSWRPWNGASVSEGDVEGTKEYGWFFSEWLEDDDPRYIPMYSHSLSCSVTITTNGAGKILGFSYGYKCQNMGLEPPAAIEPVAPQKKAETKKKTPAVPTKVAPKS